MRDTILFGDCLQTLKEFDEKARMCVTSPPYYGLRDYGGEDYQIGQEESPEEYIQKLVKVFQEVRNNLTEDGTLWLNIGDSYYNYRPGKGQALVKQTVASNKQDLPDKCARRGNKLDGLKEKVRNQVKSRFYYLFWGIATVSVVLGQIYVGSGYRIFAQSLLRIFDAVEVEVGSEYKNERFY